VTQVPQRSVTLESSYCPEGNIRLPDCQPTIQAVLATSQRSVSAPAITLDREPLALRSTRNSSEDSSAPRRQLDSGVPLAADCRGGGQTHPSQRGVPPASLLLSGPGGCSPGRRLPGGASSRYRELRRRRVVDTASRHATASVAGVQQAVSTIRFRRPGSGGPAVRCPVTWGRRPAGPAVGRLLSTRPLSNRLVLAPVRTRPSPPMLRRWRWDQVELAGRP
jgi:hypothetical protein